MSAHRHTTCRHYTLIAILRTFLPGGGGNYLARAAVGTADYRPNVLLLFLTINDFWKNNYFEVYLTDIRQIIMVVDIR